LTRDVNAPLAYLWKIACLRRKRTGDFFFDAALARIVELPVAERVEKRSSHSR
jgi:hypothetical protein